MNGSVLVALGLGPGAAAHERRRPDVDPAVRRVAIAATVVILGLLVRDLIEALSRPDVMAVYGAKDYTYYMGATRRWMAGGPFYEPWQLAGPYQFTSGTPLPGHDNNGAYYPPITLWLLVPFTFLPAALWWAIPLGVVGAVLLRTRPDVRGWPVLALCLWWPPSYVPIFNGSPVMWGFAALALGIVWEGPAVFVLLKPSLFPFAFWGVRRRRWWLVLALFGVLCLPLGTMWADWATVIRNTQGSAVLSSLLQIPLMMLPIIAWFASGPGIEERWRRARDLGRALARPDR
jgi:hypothetical protein